MLTGLLLGHSLNLCLGSPHVQYLPTPGLAYGFSLPFVVGVDAIVGFPGGASIILRVGGRSLDVEPYWVLVPQDVFFVHSWRVRPYSATFQSLWPCFGLRQQIISLEAPHSLEWSILTRGCTLQYDASPLVTNHTMMWGDRTPPCMLSQSSYLACIA